MTAPFRGVWLALSIGLAASRPASAQDDISGLRVIHTTVRLSGNWSIETSREGGVLLQRASAALSPINRPERMGDVHGYLRIECWLNSARIQIYFGESSNASEIDVSADEIPLGRMRMEKQGYSQSSEDRKAVHAMMSSLERKATMQIGYTEDGQRQLFLYDLSGFDGVLRTFRERCS